MITLYRTRHCEKSDVIQERLQELVVSHHVQIVEPAEGGEALSLPLVEDGAARFCGEVEIKRWLERIERIMELWNRFQSDSCYVGDDGEIC